MLIKLQNIIIFIISLILKISISKIFKINNKKIDYFIFISIFCFFIYYYKFDSLDQILYSLFLYLINICSFLFLIISPLEGSPSLTILNKIKKSKNCSEAKVLKYFLTKKFLEKRIDTLKNQKYIFENKKYFFYKRKNYLLFKIFYIFNKIQKNTDNG